MSDRGNHDTGDYLPYPQDTFFKYEPGTICWLKAKDDCADDVEGIAKLPDGCYNHPAVLLWTEGSGAKATIFIVSDLLHPDGTATERS
jgi:hypothetical protein